MKFKLAYFISDYLGSALAWTIFFLIRKTIIEAQFEFVLFSDPKYFLGIFLIPFFWILLFVFFGLYHQVLKKSRLKELGQIISITFGGCIIIFFTLLLDDMVGNYKNYYFSFGVLFLIQLFCTGTGRFIISTIIHKKIISGQIGFNSLIVGSNQNAIQLYHELQNSKIKEGYFFKGFVTVNGENTKDFESILPNLGNYKQLTSIIDNYQIEEVILANETSETDKIYKIMNQLSQRHVAVKLIPDIYDILSGSVRMSNVLGAVLIEVDTELMPYWQHTLKRLFDIVFSSIIIIIISPLLLLISILIILTSKGGIFYTQERLGLKSKAFKIYKFRSMKSNAEQNGPQLSKINDPRITRIGHFLRKSRLDELPQFVNVLKGEMSVVGPRPERKFFVDLIQEKAPHYIRLHKVKPGITSWGQVKYGYAENVDEMIQRLKYDLLYLENISFALDLKIIIYTVIIMIQGRGK